MSTQKWYVPSPEPSIYVKNGVKGGNRGGIKGVSQEQEYTFILEEIKYEPFVGIQVYVKNGTYPKKGFPTPESVFAINIVKTTTLEFIKMGLYFIFANKNKVLERYNKICNRVLDGYRIRDEFLCKTAYSVFLTMFHFLRDLGIQEKIALNTANNIAHIFEYDDAWRYRFQDIISECQFEALKEQPILEIKRLSYIHSLRDSDVINKKKEQVLKLLYLILRIPKVKKAFANSVTLQNAVYDNADWYWVSQRADYLFGGLTYEERVSKIVQPQQVHLVHE